MGVLGDEDEADVLPDGIVSLENARDVSLLEPEESALESAPSVREARWPQSGAHAPDYAHLVDPPKREHRFALNPAAFERQTGCYIYRRGEHGWDSDRGQSKVPTALRLSNADASDFKARATVLRAGNDLIYGAADEWDLTTPL